MDDDNDFLSLFLDEAVEILALWEASCLQLEKQSSDDTLNALFRSAHNLKGSSRSVGLKEFGAFVHCVEDLITLLKEHKLSVSRDIVGLLLECQEVLLEWVEGLRSNPHHVVDVGDHMSRVKHHLKPQSDHTKGSQGLVLFEEEPASVAPSSVSDSAPKKNLGDLLVEKGLASPEQIDDAVRLQNRKLGEILVDQGIVQQDVVQAALKEQRKQGQKQDDTIRVSTKKLDALLMAVGELSIQYGIIEHSKDNDMLHSVACLEAIELSSKILNDLHGEAMGLRMQSLDALFQRLDRTANDVARQQGKTIQVIRKGENVELDKTIIERMKDPLVHIIRNAVDHGIGPLELRREQGKPETATITLEAIQTASNILIRISDDGRGINPDKIRAKAIEKGLIKKDVKLSSSESYNLLFLPGFSTAEKVTDISGRGVGLDVVKQAVSEVMGSVEIMSQEGVGTTFQIALPASLSILDAIMVGLDTARYIIPVQDLVEVVACKELRVESVTHRGRMAALRDTIMPLLKLRDFLPLNQKSVAKEQAKEKSKEKEKEKDQRDMTEDVALIIHVDGSFVAFEVDCVMDQMSVVIRQLEGEMKRLPGVAGGTVLGSGEPGVILTLPQLAKRYLSHVV